MKKKSLGINAVLNCIKSSLSVIFPLIIYPYIYRVLQSENVGKVNFSSSIVSYFSLIAMLGVSQYAVREGAKVRNDLTNIQIFANEVFSINVISTIGAYVLLLVAILAIPKLNDYSLLIAITSITIVFTTLGVEWINVIYEDYLYITVRSIFIHVISIVMIFLLVKDASDIYLYTFLSIIGTIVTGLSNWFYCRKYLKLKFVLKINFKRHFKPIITLFANAVATNIYVNSDVTMIGWFVGDHNVGVYSLSVRIYSVVKNILSSLYTVTVPRISFYIGQNNFGKVKELYTKLVSGITLLLLPASVGMVCIAPEIIIIMGGAEYSESVISLQILGVSLIGAIFGGLLTYCLNIPLGREKINFNATIFSALINIGLNFILVPIYKQNGAAVTTVISEFFVMGYCLFKARSIINTYLLFQEYKKNLLHAIVGAVIVVISSIIIHRLIGISTISLFLISASSMIGYLLLLIVLRNEMVTSVIRIVSNDL